MNHIFVDTSEIFIEKESVVFDDGSQPITHIHVTSGVHVNYTMIPSADGSTKRVFFLGSQTHFVGSAIFLWANMVSQMSVVIEWQETRASLSLLGLAEDGSRIHIDGVGRVESGSADIELRIDQTNILLGENTQIHGKPVLEIATDTITGGHSCKVHRISGDALFYLQSHGIDHSTAEGMLLEAEIMKHTSPLGDEQKKWTETILDRLAQKIPAPL